MVFFGTSGRWAFLSGGFLFVVLAGGLKYLWFIESIEIDGVFACVCIYVYMNNHVASCVYVRAFVCVYLRVRVFLRLFIIVYFTLNRGETV